MPLYKYTWGIPRQFDRGLAVMSQIFSLIFYMKVSVTRTHFFLDFFLLLAFKKSFKKIRLAKIRKNSNKSN